MTNPSGKPTLQEETINAVARRARTLRTRVRVMACITLSWILVTVSSVIIASPAFGRWGMLLGLLILPVFIWINVEEARARSSCRKFSDIFVTGHSDALQSVSSSAIGPLLEVTITGAINGRFLQTPAALLGDLLKTVRAEEEVVLSNGQRNLLHELVIRGRWDRIKVHYGIGMEKAVRCELRPSAIRSLSWLGDRSSIPVLERFARKTDDPELRQSALQSIEQIRERLQYGPEQMLRASRSPEHPDTLLRAVSPAKPHDHDPQQLLRADNATSHPQGKSALSQTAKRTMPD